MEILVSTVLGGLFSFLLLYKYAALFLIGYVAAVALPIPASMTLVAAGAFASQGYFTLLYVLITAFVANLGGDATAYLLAREYGENAFRAIGLGWVLHNRSYKKLEEYMRNFPQTVIYISRFMTEIGPATSILSGLSRVRRRTFFTFAALGELSYVLLYGLTGYYLGSEWQNNLGFLFKAVMMIVSIGVTLNIAQWLLYRRKSRQ